MDIETLVGAEHPAIQTAAGAYTEAKTAALKARREAIALEQERPAAEELDAVQAAHARREHKPEPKTRQRTLAHDKKLADAQHEARVTSKLEELARQELLAVWNEHKPEIESSLAEDVDTAEKAWTAAVDALAESYAKLSRSLSARHRIAGGDMPPIGSLPFKPRELKGIDLAQGSHTQTAYIEVSIVLTQLAALSKPEPVKEISQDHATPRGRSPLADDAAVVREREERERFLQARAAEGTIRTADGAVLFIGSGSDDED